MANRESGRGAAMTLRLSARAFHRILKPCRVRGYGLRTFGELVEWVSRTIADLSTGSRQALAGADAQTAHLAEALQYRPREMGQAIRPIGKYTCGDKIGMWVCRMTAREVSQTQCHVSIRCARSPTHRRVCCKQQNGAAVDRRAVGTLAFLPGDRVLGYILALAPYDDGG